MSYRGRRQQGIPGLYGGDARGLYGSNSYGRGSMIYGKRRSPRWPRFILGIIALLIIVLCIKQFACGGVFPKSDEDKGSTQETTQQQEEEATQEPVESGATGTLTISAVGDCTLGVDPDFDSDSSFDNIYKTNNSSYFFKRVTKYTENDDLTIANLEGALTDEGTLEDKGENSYNFKGPKKYAKILSKGSVEVCNLANNHSFDYGSDGYADTKAALDDEKIGYANADLVYCKEINGIKVGMLGINCTASYEDATEVMNESIKALQDQNADLIIAMFHWGVEGEYAIEENQQKIAHAAIDAGVGLVLGSHSHLLGGVEKYNDRYIVYSLGNFVFGGNDDPMDYSTMIYQMSFTFDNGELDVSSMLGSAKIVPCRVSTVKSVNNYQPLPLGGDEGKKVVKKVNKLSKALSGTGVTFSTSLDDDNFAVVKTSN